MIGKQLDLFGTPLKPPSKITVDDESTGNPPVFEDISDAKHSKADEVPPPAEADLDSATFVHVQMPVPEVAQENEPDEYNGENIVPVDAEALDGDLANVAGIESDDDIAEVKEIIAATENDTAIEDEEDASKEEQVEEQEQEDEQEDEQEEVVEEQEVEQEEEEQEDELAEAEEVAEESLDEVGMQPVDGNQESATEDTIGADGLNIPADPALFSRQYYTMRETATMFSVNQSLLRFWENEFDILKPKKNRKGDRYFRPEDIKNLELIYHLLRVRRFTISGAKEYLKNRSKSLDTFEMVQRLEKIKHFLLELKAHY